MDMDSFKYLNMVTTKIKQIKAKICVTTNKWNLILPELFNYIVDVILDNLRISISFEFKFGE